ncbi:MULTISPECIES: hypothetical protein [unclassified Pseudofrankia]|uniref:hypothetical protein n=1 Tax=unclassified Pseudofrankia TaxID=2994372 RepID=UPI0008D9C9D8|nr:MULTISPECIES: hypothetical protein [unclassified Pseudofrankia]MDT3439332.1 hypothetical protein [Pseudofrankia sp. BMG5.37]OHV73952.1 hypothetical protein BCD48_32950 [Pseudofrankia sp. BMG5.36]
MVDPEAFRQQELTRLRYEVIASLLGRERFALPFAPADRRLHRGGVETIDFSEELGQGDYVKLQENPKSRPVRADLESDGKTVRVPPHLVRKSLETVEIYDSQDHLIKLGPKF